MSRASANRITIKKTLHMKEAQVACMAYMSASKPVLAENLALRGARNGQAMRRVSEDNGKSWSALPGSEKGHLLGRSTERRGDHIATRTTAATYLMENVGVLVEFMAEVESSAAEEMSFGPEAAAQEHIEFRTGRIFYRLSRDEGRSWGPLRQLIQKGRGYTPTHWADGLWHGKNGCFLTGLTLPIRLRDGALLLPVYFYRLDEKGSLLNWVDRFGDMIWPVAAAACFRGEWDARRGDFDWHFSTPVTAPEYVSHGMDECEVAEVEGGKLMMIIRGGACGWQSFPGVKFFATSKDGGRTWGPPVPLTYPDGTFVNSPACLPNLFRSSKNGRLYLIANIVDHPCRQSDPRYPLVIAEVDPKYYWVLPETITVIEDRKPRHPKGVRFSNWQRIEDRETGNPVIFMTEARYDSIIPDTKETIIPHSYRYEIVLPKS